MNVVLSRKFTYGTRKPSKATGVIFAVIGISILYFGLKIVFETRNFLKKAETTTGTVVRNVLDSKGEHSSPVVTFRAKTGAKVEFTSELASTPEQYQVNQQVPVAYDADNPSYAKINTPINLWLPGGLLTILGIAFASAGISVLKAEQSDTTDQNEPLKPLNLEENVKELQDMLSKDKSFNQDYEQKN